MAGHGPHRSIAYGILDQRLKPRPHPPRFRCGISRLSGTFSSADPTARVPLASKTPVLLDILHIVSARPAHPARRAIVTSNRTDPPARGNYMATTLYRISSLTVAGLAIAAGQWHDAPPWQNTPNEVCQKPVVPTVSPRVAAPLTGRIGRLRGKVCHQQRSVSRQRRRAQRAPRQAPSQQGRRFPKQESRRRPDGTTLNHGDRLQVSMDADRWELLNDDGTAVGQLVRGFQCPAWRGQGLCQRSGHHLLGQDVRSPSTGRAYASRLGKSWCRADVCTVGLTLSTGIKSAKQL